MAADRIESASADIAKENLTRRPQGKEAPAQACSALGGVVNLQRRADDFGVFVDQTGDKGIGVAHFDHHRAEHIRVVE